MPQGFYYMKQEIKSLKTKNNSLPLIIGSFDVIHKKHKKLFDKEIILILLNNKN